MKAYNFALNRHVLVKLRFCLLAFFFIFGSKPLFAQKGLSITLFGMPQRTFMYDSKPEIDYSVLIHIYEYPYFYLESRVIQKKPSYNFAFGFMLNHLLTKRFIINYGLQYAPFEQKYNTSFQNNAIYVENAIRLKYIKIPVDLRYNYLVKEYYSLFVSAGPQLNVLIAENGSMPVYRYLPELQTSIFDIIDPGGIYNDFVLGAIISTGGEFKLDNKISIFIKAYFDRNITKVEKKSFEDVTETDSYKIFESPNVTLKSKDIISLGLSIGLTFKIRTGKVN